MKITYKKELNSKTTHSPADIVDIVLNNRNITDVKSFINPASPLNMNIDAFGYTKEIATTTKMLREIKDTGKSIVVYTDYDADGITGGAILWETLHLLGFKVMPYVPHRQHEGYGFSKKGIDAIKEKFNPALIISVDHGITAQEKIIYSKSLGIPVIVTDHHLKPEQGPDAAEAVFHIPALSGSGVSYFFSKMLYEHFGTKDASNARRLESNFAADYMALASIGTIADLVPLVGPSRSIAKHGLSAFQRVQRIGIRHILEQAGINGRPITPYEIGFMIAPRINAIGRLSHALDALRLLCTTSEKRAMELAAQIGDSNKTRQDMVKTAIAEALEQIEKNYGTDIPNVIILKSDTWHEGIIGLIASKIIEKYYRPTIIMTKSEQIYKGSARSIPAFHMTNFLRSLKEYLIDVGGHAQAAGFSIEKKKIGQFMKAAHKMAEPMLKPQDLEKTLEADIKLSVSQIDINSARSLEALEPFGIGNPHPLFYSQVELVDAKLMGKTKNHLKLFVHDADNPSSPLELVSFSTGERYTELTKGMSLDIVYNPEVNRWNGREKLNGKLKYFSAR